MTVCRFGSKVWACFGALLLMTSLLLPAAGATDVMPPRPIGPPVIDLPLPPLLVVAEARLPIRLQQMTVRAEVLGTVAHTRIELVFYNPNQRELEGELQFPLLDGQSVTGFALDIDGVLRPAVPVEKVKGEQVFEDVIRARVDPALLEKTRGNNYKLRLYPLPARGTRRVALEFDEVLTATDSGSSYRLPLQFAETVELLDVAVHSAVAPVAKAARLGAETLAVSPDPPPFAGASVQFTRKNFAGQGLLNIDFPASQAPLLATETRIGQTYFYAEVTPPSLRRAPRPAPRTVGLIWDASGSGAARDHGREFALLDAYFKQLQQVEVALVIARDQAQAPQHFSIDDGDWQALRTVLESLAYDGATTAAALSPAGNADLNLLFSDGLINYGAGALVAGSVPLYALNAAASADLPRLRAVAETSGGRLLDLLGVSTDTALTALIEQAPRLVGLRSNGAKELVSASVYAEGGRVQIAGILTEVQTVVTLSWLDGKGQAQTQAVNIAPGAQSLAPLAALRFAALQLAQLESDAVANRAAIRRLGNRFGLVTRETSLIVLDRVEDYVRYEIVPPESLRGEYEQQLAQKAGQLQQERRSHLDSIVAGFQQKQAWWAMDFPKGKRPKPPQEEVKAVQEQPVMAMATDGERHDAHRPEETLLEEPVRGEPSPLMARANAEMMASPPAEAVFADAANPSAPPTASIQLQKWVPDSVYAQRLRAAPVEQMYAIYLDERPTYVNSTAFFLDAADLFSERNQPELSLRILSNLAEMNLENRHILRVLAYRLLQAKQVKLALPVLQQVLVLAPDEPQSWRDLGLAYAENGQYQPAVDHLWQVVARPWHDRFPEIELIALAELNAIIARLPRGVTVDSSAIDPRLLHNLPLAVRAVLSWDADNADIDLWVIDPNDEKVYYGNPLGYQGGRISRDFTGGYGPEEFSLRVAKPGTYRVQAQFYGNRQQLVTGATTLMLRLSTGFGTGKQQDQNIIVRLDATGEVVEVGTFTVR